MESDQSNRMSYIPLDQQATQRIQMEQVSDTSSEQQDGNESAIPVIDLTIDDNSPEVESRSVPPLRSNTITPIVCLNSRRGCALTFRINMARNQHITKCVYSFLNYCKHKDCIASGNQKFDTFNELVTHAKRVHKCPTIKGNSRDHFRVMMNLKKDFFSEKDKDFCSKIIATYEEMVNGHLFCIAFIALDQNKHDRFSIIPVVYGKKKRDWDFVRLKMLLKDEKGSLMRPVEPLVHESHNVKSERMIFCRAYGPGKFLFDAIRDDNIIKYSKDVLLRSSNDDFVTLSLTFKPMFYRCSVRVDNNKNDVEYNIRPYLITPEQIATNESVQEMLKVSSEKPALAMSGVLLPQLRAGNNLLVQSLELNQVASIFFAHSWETKLHNIPLLKHAARKQVVSVVLFPSAFMLRTTGTTFQQMANSVGLDCKIITLNVNDHQFREFIDYGCDVLITCTSMFTQLTREERTTPSSDVLFEKLTLALLPHADYLLHPDKKDDIKSSFEGIHKNVKSNIIKLLVTPVLCKDLSLSVVNDVYGSNNFLTVFLGPKRQTVLAPLPIIELKSTCLTEKIDMVVKLLRTHNQDKSWLILAFEDEEQNYQENFNMLLHEIEEKLPGKTNFIMRRDENMDSTDPDCFRLFENQPGSILLATYFSLHYDAVIRSSEGIIMFEMPSTYADAMRIVPIANSLNKPVYWFYEKKSNGISFRDFLM